MLFFEVIETDISIRDGEIEKNKQTTDSIGIRYLGSDDSDDSYEIQLSENAWSRILFGRQCKYLEEQIEDFPLLNFARNKKTGKLRFQEPKTIGDFLKRNYERRLECINSAEDKYMRKHIISWMRLIEVDSLDQFVNSYSAHFLHIVSLYDLLVPANNRDTLLCTISTTGSGSEVTTSYETIRRLNQDLTLSYYYTDKVDQISLLTKEFMDNLYKPYEKYFSVKEKLINDLRLKSIRSEDKSIIELSASGEFNSYLRIRQSVILDSNLKPRHSFYNYEIKRIISAKED